MLHEVLVLTTEVVHPDVRMPALITRQTQAAIDRYLDSLPTPARRDVDRPDTDPTYDRSGITAHRRPP